MGLARWSAIVAAAAVAGAGIATGGTAATLGGAIAGLTVVGALATRLRIPQRVGVLAIEAPIVLLALSSLVFRMRDTNAISNNPLDSAGLFRMGCIGLATLLAVMAIMRSDVRGKMATLRRARPLWTYVGYLVIATIGITQSVFPLLTAFRVVNLVLALFVIVAAYLTMGEEGLDRAEKTIFWFMIAHLATAWIGVVIAPGLAIRPASPIPFRIEGVLPAMASDRIGEYGAIIFLWCYAARNGVLRDHIVPTRRMALALEGFGIASLLAAQYRTGYLAVAVGLLIILALRGRVVLATAIGAAGFLLAQFGATLFAPLFSFFLRGQSVALASKLSGRTSLWSAAVPVWRESPWVGSGLETASRFEVLENLGRGFTGSLHGTWIEALVGTGALGIAFLVATLVMVLVRGYLMASRGGRLAPILIVSVLVVRSVTGSSFETFGVEAMLFMAMLMAVRVPQSFRRPQPLPSPLSPEARFPAPGGVPVGAVTARSRLRR
jgi:hypothetical protein